MRPPSHPHGLGRAPGTMANTAVATPGKQREARGRKGSFAKSDGRPAESQALGRSPAWGRPRIPFLVSRGAPCAIARGAPHIFFPRRLSRGKGLQRGAREGRVRRMTALRPPCVFFFLFASNGKDAPARSHRMHTARSAEGLAAACAPARRPALRPQGQPYALKPRRATPAWTRRAHRLRLSPGGLRPRLRRGARHRRARHVHPRGCVPRCRRLSMPTHQRNKDAPKHGIHHVPILYQPQTRNQTRDKSGT